MNDATLFVDNFNRFNPEYPRQSLLKTFTNFGSKPALRSSMNEVNSDLRVQTCHCTTSIFLRSSRFHFSRAGYLFAAVVNGKKATLLGNPTICVPDCAIIAVNEHDTVLSVCGRKCCGRHVSQDTKFGRTQRLLIINNRVFRFEYLECFGEFLRCLK